jgi:hypothetical protein
MSTFLTLLSCEYSKIVSGQGAVIFVVFGVYRSKAHIVHDFRGAGAGNSFGE